MIESTMGFRGNLTAKLIKGSGRAPLKWRLRNALRLSFLWGLLANKAGRALSGLTGLPVFTSELRAVHIAANGFRTDYGVLSRRVVTDAGIVVLRDDFVSGAGEITNFKYHGCGTGVTAEAAGDTALVTESTTALNPDSTRATGTNTAPAGNQYQTVGTLTFDASAAVTEHGIFSQAATGGGVLWDRSVFAAINVVNLDSIQFTYVLTITGS